MAEKITALTDAQRQQLFDWRDQWLAIGRACGPANMDVVQPILVDFYKRLKKDAPPFLHARSPREAHLLVHLLKHVDVKDLSKQAKVEEHQVQDTLYNNVNYLLEEWSQSHAQNDAYVRRSLKTELEDELMAPMLEDVKAAMDDEKVEYLYPSLYGAYEAHWIAYYLFPHLFLRPIHTDEQMVLLNQWAELAKNCGLVYAFDEVCVVCDRPDVQDIDADRRLHSETGPAMAFADGWQLFYIHGIRVKPHVVLNPETISVKEVDDERNVELRRILLDRMGWDRYIAESEAEIIDVDPSDLGGTLYRRSFPDDEPLVMVKVLDPSTDRRYFLRVPPTITTAREAVAWTFGRDARSYAPAAQS